MVKPKKKINKSQNHKQIEISDVEVAKKLINIYQSAMDRKLEFGLSFESVKGLLRHQTCYYTGRKFESEGPYSRSIDRVDSAKGYIEGNVVSCTIDINGKKSNLSEEEIELLYKKIVLPKKVKDLPIETPVSDLEMISSDSSYIPEEGETLILEGETSESNENNQIL
jgi:hypothetical protein